MQGTQFAFVVCPSPGCAQVFVPRWDGGRPQKWCSRKCSLRAWRLRTDGPPPKVQCEGPDCASLVVADRTRKYCSPQCRQRAHYQTHIEVKRERAKSWKRARRQAGLWPEYDPVQAAVYYQRRRARKLAADNRVVTKADIRRMYARQDGRCLACGEQSRLTVDHLVPLSRGGRHAIGNLAGLCGACNSSKRDLTWMEFRLDRPRPRRRAA